MCEISSKVSCGCHSNTCTGRSNTSSYQIGTLYVCILMMSSSLLLYIATCSYSDDVILYSHMLHILMTSSSLLLYIATYSLKARGSTRALGRQHSRAGPSSFTFSMWRRRTWSTVGWRYCYATVTYSTTPTSPG